MGSFLVVALGSFFAAARGGALSKEGVPAAGVAAEVVTLAEHRGSNASRAHSAHAELPAWEPALGQYAFNITTDDALAQRFFSVGLILLYNFDQPNARRAFDAALEVDPTCAMCAWGIAHSYGPYLNRPTRTAGELSLGRAAARRAAVLLGRARGRHTAKEAALVGAMLLRYPEGPGAEDQLKTYRAYAARLRSSRAADPGGLGADPDLMVFDAEAMMVLMCDERGYHFYVDNGDDTPPTQLPGAREAAQLLRMALAATNQSHPHAQHLLIHSTEMSNAEAEAAVQVAVHLMKQMAPSQNQHLQHMSSHTFLRTGRYHEAVESNEASVSSDHAYMQHGMVPYGPGHNSVFLVCAALWGGERAVAYRYARAMQGIFRSSPGRRDGPDGSMAWSYPMLVALRFGDWEAVGRLDAAPPGDYASRWPYGHGVVRHFSLAVQAVHLAQRGAAEAHIAALRGLVPAVAATGRAQLANLTRIANYTASGIYAYAAGDLAGAVGALGLAVGVEMGMPYDEPPPWLLPSRECYGQALLDGGRAREAERVFRSALHGYSFHAEPRCGWALFGLRASLEQQQRRNWTGARAEEIRGVTARIGTAWRHADVPLSSACLHLGGPGRHRWLV